MNLNHARLPIPPFPHGTGYILHLFFIFVKGFLRFFFLLRRMQAGG
nr:hypothetical protein [Clostridia bacterium]